MAAGRQNFSRKSYSNCLDEENRYKNRFDSRVSVRTSVYKRNESYECDRCRVGREPYGSSQSMCHFDQKLRDRNKEVDVSENFSNSGSTKKRKFSPIVWDRVEKQVRILSKNRILPAGSVLNQSSAFKSSNDFLKLQDSDRDLRIERCSVSSVESIVSNVSDEVEGPNSLATRSHRVHDHELGNEEGEYVEERNLSKSKWAFEDSPKTESGVNNSSPESGEFKRECFEGKQEVSSLTTDYGLFVVQSSEDEPSEDVVDKVTSSPEDDNDDVHEETICTGFDMLPSCRNADVYKRVKEIGVGTYGVVHQAVDKKTGEIVALKKVKMGDTREGFPMTALREINILATLQHPSIVEVKEVVMDDYNGVYMVMEHIDYELKKYMDHMKQPFSQSEVKCLMIQLLEGMSYLHDNWVIHRDLKTSNLLLNNKGKLKICDFGMARRYVSPEKPYTPLVVTLWYRAPEVLLGMKQYSTAIDMWSVGCIMAELLSKKPLFDGNRELEQIDKIFRTLGTPNESIWPGYSKLPGVKPNFARQPFNTLRKKFPVASFTGAPSLTELGFDLLNRFLTYDPKKRITAEEALNHGWFREAPLPAEHVRICK